MVLKILFLLCVKFPGDEERRKRTKQFLLVGMERGFSCGIFQQFYSGRVSVTHCVRVHFFPKIPVAQKNYISIWFFLMNFCLLKCKRSSLRSHECDFSVIFKHRECGVTVCFYLVKRPYHKNMLSCWTRIFGQITFD